MWWCIWNLKTDTSQRRLRHKTTLCKNHNVGWSLLTDVVMHLFSNFRCITTSVKSLQPTLWVLHNVVLCLNRRGLIPSYGTNSANHNVGFFVLTDIVVFNTKSVSLTDVMINVSWVNVGSVPDEKCLSEPTTKTLFVLVS